MQPLKPITRNDQRTLRDLMQLWEKAVTIGTAAGMSLDEANQATAEWLDAELTLKRV